MPPKRSFLCASCQDPLDIDRLKQSRNVNSIMCECRFLNFLSDEDVAELKRYVGVGEREEQRLTSAGFRLDPEHGLVPIGDGTEVLS